MTVGIGTTTVTANLTTTSPNCTTPPRGNLTCTVAVPAPPGQQTFVVRMFDQLNGNGNLLSDVTAGVTLTAYATNTINLTLNGDVANIAVAIAPAPSATPWPACTSATVPVTVNAYDADHKLIVGPGNYSNPITLSNSDKSGATSLSGSPIAGPGAGATLTYTGGYLASTTIAASATSVPSANVTSATFAPVPQVCKEFADTALNSAPRGIAVNNDGNLYYAEFGAHNIAHVSTSGSITEVPETGGTAGIVSGQPQNLVSGPDHLVYVTDAQNGIVQYDPSSLGQTLFAPTPMPSPSAGVTAPFEPYQITNGPAADGRLWIAFRGGDRIGAMTTAGVFTLYALPQHNVADYPTSVVAGPDGAMWFTESNYDHIGRITLDGSQTLEFPVTASAMPFFITTGSDGNLWFTERNGNAIGRITPAGAVTEFSLPTTNSQPTQIVSGPDGNLYFTETNANKIGQILVHAPNTVTEFAIPTASSAPYGITVGPDNNVWFTEQSGLKVGYLTI